MRSAALALLLVTLGCSRESPTAAAAPSAPAASASAPVAVHDLVLHLTTTPEASPDGQALAVSLAVENRSKRSQKIAYFRPLGFQLTASDPSSGRVITIGIPPADMPVERVEVTLAPGETRTLGGSTLWFDETGKLHGSIFDWTAKSNKQPLKLVAKLSIELVSDGGTVELEATTIAA